MSFIFQAIPDRYDLRTKMKVGHRVSWVASRHRSLMKKGDIVYFWLAGDPAHRGLYGWGVIFALYKALFEHEGRAYRVIVEYQRNFLEHKKHKHIPSEDIRKNPILRDLLIFRMPVGTNFLLTDEEDRALRGIIAQEFGEDWLPPLHSERGGV